MGIEKTTGGVERSESAAVPSADTPAIRTTTAIENLAADRRRRAAEATAPLVSTDEEHLALKSEVPPGHSSAGGPETHGQRSGDTLVTDVAATSNDGATSGRRNRDHAGETPDDSLADRGHVVHDLGQAAGTNRAEATELVSHEPNDRYFLTQENALNAALDAHPGLDRSLMYTEYVYGKFPNLIGPKGEPWERVFAWSDKIQDFVPINHHPSGHYFEDTHTYALPHYHVPEGHYFYGNERKW